MRLRDYDLDPQKLAAARGLMSKTEAARRLGISRQLLEAYEAGHSYPSFPRLLQILDTYGLTLEQLLSPKHQVQRAA